MARRNPDYATLRREAVHILTNAGIETPALDVRLLLQQASGKTAAELIACDKEVVEESVLDRFHELVGRRAAYEPVAYILGRKAFWTSEFIVSEDVLVPRPETEILVSEALALISDVKSPRILDIGTGSAAILISLLLERPEATGTGVDISEKALDIARQNIARHGMDQRADVYLSDYLDQVCGRFDLIVSNPPYISEADMRTLSPDSELYEPEKALFGGSDGLEAYRSICARISEYLKPGGSVAFEIGFSQKDAVISILEKTAAYDIKSTKDLAGLDRVVSARFP